MQNKMLVVIFFLSWAKAFFSKFSVSTSSSASPNKNFHSKYDDHKYRVVEPEPPFLAEAGKKGGSDLGSSSSADPTICFVNYKIFFS